MAVDVENKSLCRSDLDHVLPWSRGGLSVSGNLRLLHWGANRNVKKAFIGDMLPEQSLQVGLSVDQFLRLIRSEVCFLTALMLCYDIASVASCAATICRGTSCQAECKVMGVGPLSQPDSVLLRSARLCLLPFER